MVCSMQVVLSQKLELALNYVYPKVYNREYDSLEKLKNNKKLIK